MAKVFISYAHVSPDQDLAQQLSSLLETNNFSVFVDSKIRLGQGWAEQIDRQLRESQYFVVLLSPRSIESDMVRREIALAYKLGKAKSLTLLPVRLGLEGELPYDVAAYLDLIQYAVWNPGESFDSICRVILQAMDSTPLSIATPISQIPSIPITQSGPAENIDHFDPADLYRLKQTLAAYVGPIARVMVDRAAKKAKNLQQLYESLSSEIEAPTERARFLATRPR